MLILLVDNIIDAYKHIGFGLVMIFLLNKLFSVKKKTESDSSSLSITLENIKELS